MYPIGTINIQLQKAANGWIVVLPHIYEPEPLVDWTDPRYVKKVVGLMKEEYRKDPDLEKLGHYDDIQVEQDITVPIPGTPRGPQNNIYIFSSYSEASDFIKGKYDN